MNETLQIILQILSAITGILIIVKQFVTDKKVKEVVDKVEVVKTSQVVVNEKMDKVQTAQAEVHKEINGRMGELIELTKKSSKAEGDLAARAQIKLDAETEDTKPEYMIKKMLEDLKKTITEAVGAKTATPTEVIVTNTEENPAIVKPLDKK